jgi:hypothetical protein
VTARRRSDRADRGVPRIGLSSAKGQGEAHGRRDVSRHRLRRAAAIAECADHQLAARSKSNGWKTRWIPTQGQ